MAIRYCLLAERTTQCCRRFYIFLSSPHLIQWLIPGAAEQERPNWAKKIGNLQVAAERFKNNCLCVEGGGGRGGLLCPDCTAGFTSFPGWAFINSRTSVGKMRSWWEWVTLLHSYDVILSKVLESQVHNLNNGLLIISWLTSIIKKKKIL